MQSSGQRVGSVNDGVGCSVVVGGNGVVVGGLVSVSVLVRLFEYDRDGVREEESSIVSSFVIVLRETDTLIEADDVTIEETEIVVVPSSDTVPDTSCVSVTVVVAECVSSLVGVRCETEIEGEVDAEFSFVPDAVSVIVGGSLDTVIENVYVIEFFSNVTVLVNIVAERSTEGVILLEYDVVFSIDGLGVKEPDPVSILFESERDSVGDAEEEPEGVRVKVREMVAVGVGARVSVPVTLGERVCEGVPVKVPDGVALGEIDTEEVAVRVVVSELESVEVDDALIVPVGLGDGLVVCDADVDSVLVPLLLSVGDDDGDSEIV
eukprot:PhM_4_TR4985/c0_g1_i1/m.85374